MAKPTSLQTHQSKPLTGPYLEQGSKCTPLARRTCRIQQHGHFCVSLVVACCFAKCHVTEASAILKCPPLHLVSVHLGKQHKRDSSDQMQVEDSRYTLDCGKTYQRSNEFNGNKRLRSWLQLHVLSSKESDLPIAMHSEPRGERSKLRQASITKRMLHSCTLYINSCMAICGQWRAPT